MEGQTQQAAAAAAAMSERTARRWQRGALPSVSRKDRHRWRTRPDPFADVWESDVEPLLRSDPEGELSATTILEWRVASMKMLPKRSYCLTQMLPKSGRCLMMVLPKPRRHGYGHGDQRSHEDRSARSHPQPVQESFEEG